MSTQEPAAAWDAAIKHVAAFQPSAAMLEALQRGVALVELTRAALTAPLANNKTGA